MKTQKISKSSRITFYFISILTILLGLFAIIAHDNDSTTKGLIIKCIFFISISVPTVKLIEIYMIYFINYIFCVPNTWWVKEVQRPRLLFNILGIVVIIFSIFLLQDTAHETPQFKFILSVITALGCYLIGFSFIIVSWTTCFEKSLNRIRHKLFYSNYKCKLNNRDYNLNNLLKDLRSNFGFECEYKTFLDFVNLYSIDKSKRIKVNVTAELIRFIFIVFNISRDKETQLDHTFFRNIISDYFIGNDQQDIKITLTGTEFSRSRNENSHNTELVRMINVIESNTFN